MGDCTSLNMVEPVVYFSPSQTKELLSIADSTGLVLMQHYVAIAHQPNPNMEDKTLSTMLEKSVKTIEATRLKLTKAGWFKRIKFKTKGEAHIMYLVGKEAVSNSSSSCLQTGQ